MKILVLDDPMAHRSPMHSLITKAFRDCEISVVEDFQKAVDQVGIEKPDWVVIHHADSLEAAMLKGQFPNIHLAAYSSHLNRACNPGSVSDCFAKELEKDYEVLFYPFERDSWRQSLGLEPHD